jgi:hypothetical protein
VSDHNPSVRLSWNWSAHNAALTCEATSNIARILHRSSRRGSCDAIADGHLLKPLMIFSVDGVANIDFVPLLLSFGS